MPLRSSAAACSLLVRHHSAEKNRAGKHGVFVVRCRREKRREERTSLLPPTVITHHRHSPLLAERNLAHRQGCPPRSPPPLFPSSIATKEAPETGEIGAIADHEEERRNAARENRGDVVEDQEKELVAFLPAVATPKLLSTKEMERKSGEVLVAAGTCHNRYATTCGGGNTVTPAAAVVAWPNGRGWRRCQHRRTTLLPRTKHRRTLLRQNRRTTAAAFRSPEGEKNQSPLDRCGEVAGRKKRRCSPLEEIRRTTAAVVARVLAKLDETEVTRSKGENPRRQALLLRLSRGVPLPPPIIITHAPPPANEKGREAIPLTSVATPY
nr:hypothetical protein Iba_chr10eCG11430 [Ipomoea batatas]